MRRNLDRRGLPFSVALAAAVFTLIGIAKADYLVKVEGVESLSLPVPGMTDSAMDRFNRGKVLFRQAWLMPPALDDQEFVGLGPTYNDLSCIGCHVKNGRGSAPDGPNDQLHGLLIRVSIDGRSESGGPNPHPAYGDQIEDHAVPGVEAEGRVHIHYRDTTIPLPDGTNVTLRAPKIEISDLHFGPLGKHIHLSARLAQPLVGLGLLESIPEAAIWAKAAEQKAQGGPVHGHPNWIWNQAKSTMSIGRFGWKANQPDIIQQSAGAALGDMGLSSALFPQKNCPSVQIDCAKAPSGPSPNLSAERLSDLAFYVSSLAVPERPTTNPSIEHGAATFRQIGCESCHVSTWKTAPYTSNPAFADQIIHPYTDLLLHDLGAGLSDRRPDFSATGREWRTAPLWGLGVSRMLSPRTGFLHDGRARSVAEAIAWHGGEALTSQRHFIHLSPQDRQDLLAFLQSL